MTGTVSPGKVAFGCVAESTPRFYAQVMRLIQSIRWFGGSLADADIFVCVVGEVDPATCTDFTALGAHVRTVSGFNPLNRFCNKVRFLELPELEHYETIALLDCDTVLVQDPTPYFVQPSLQLKIADQATVSSAVLAKLCAHFGLNVPAPIYQTTCSQEPTIWYCNTGVMILPSVWIAQILPVWRDYILQLCAEPGLFGPPYNHCNQAAMTLVYAAQSLPFAELPVAMNFPLNQTHQLPAPALLREDPVILHYHDRVDRDGLLLPAPYPLAQARIQKLNERLRASGPQQFAARTNAGAATHKTHSDTLPPAPFIIGADQHSTMLLGLTLGSHPELAMLPAMHSIPEIARACQRASHPAERFVENVAQHPHWPDFQIDQETLREAVMSLEPFTVGGGLRVVYQTYAARFGKPRYGDATTSYSQYAEQIQALLPEARFINLIRDARDAARAPQTASASGDSVEEIARDWAANARAVRNQAHELQHSLEVRYETLIGDPETTLRQICAFLDLSWDPAMLDHYECAVEQLGERAVAETETGKFFDPQNYPLNDQTAPAAGSVAVCITGMHRSGTSLVGQILHHCGPYLGPYRLLAVPLADNLDGYWEHPDVRKLNDDILAHFGGGWDAAPTLPDGWEQLPEIESLRQRARMLIRQFDDQPFWGWKDPRTALTMPFWRQLLPNLKVVICVRNPLEVALSLSQRSMSSLAFGLRLWHTYYERLLAAVGPTDRIITHYDAYFTDAMAETSRILNWLGIPTSSASIRRVCAGTTNELRHQRASIAGLIACGAPSAVLRLYAQLCDEVDVPSGTTLAADTTTTAGSDEAFVAALIRAQESELTAALAKSEADLTILKLVLQARDAEVAFLSPTLAARETEVADVARELEATGAIVQARETEIASLARELETTSAIVQARETEIAGFAKELESVRGLLAAREAELVDSVRELQVTRAIVRAREAEIASFALELDSIRGLLAAREAERTGDARELAATRALVRARETEIAGFAQEWESGRSLLAMRETEIADFARELGSMCDLLAAREAEIADFARELEATRVLVQAREAEIAGFAHASH